MELDGNMRGIMNPSTSKEHPPISCYPVLNQIIASRWVLFEAWWNREWCMDDDEFARGGNPSSL